GLLAGVVAGPILGHRLDERHWYTQHHLYTPYTWPMGLKSDESVVRMFGDSYDLPQKLGKRGEGYYRKAFNLGMELPGETAEATKARLDWVREQPAVLEFLQQRSLTPNRDRPMRVVDSRELKVGNNRNPDLCSGGTVERQEQEKTASEKAAVEEKAPDYHWYRPGSWEHWYTPWKGQKNNAAQSETAKTATDDKATVAATTKTPEVSTPGPEKTPAAPTQEKAAETKTLSGTQTRNDMPPACATTFGWSADPKVGFKDIFQDGMRQTRIKKGANIKQEVPLVRVKPDGSYNAADLASYMPSDQNDGFTTANKFCCTLSVRYEELPDSRVFNSAPGSADRFLDTMEKDLFNKDGKGKLVRNDGRGRTFVDANGQVKPGYFDDQETIYGMVEAGHLVNLDQGRRMRDLGLNEIDNVNFVQSNIESRSMQRFVTMCTRADDKTYARKEGNGQKKPRDELLSAWRENVGAAKPGLDPVMASIPEDVLGSALDKTLSEKRDLTEDVSKEYEQVKLRREFTSLALDQTALDILTADKDILGVVRSYETPAAEFRVVRPRASGFVYSLSKYKKDGGNVQDFSLSAPDEHGTRQGPKVAGARSKGYISRTGQVEDGAPAKSGVTAEAVDPAIAKFWETQVGFANMVHGVENGLHDAKGKAAKAEGRIFGDALETVYKRDWAAMRLGIETELYRVLSATDNGGSDPAAKAEKAAFDRRKTMQLNVSGKGADMQVTPAGKGAQKQLKAF